MAMRWENLWQNELRIKKFMRKSFAKSLLLIQKRIWQDFLQ